MFGKQIGIDLGTVNIRVYVHGKGIILREPSIVAISVLENKIVAVGNEARAMLGRTPESIEVARPLRDGVIAEFDVTQNMLRYFIERVCGRFRLFRPEIMISTPVGVTSVESRAVRDAAIQAGGKHAYLIPEPLAAALGAGLPTGTPTGNMIVDIGGGTTEAAVISMNDIVVSSSIRVGGNKLDEAIAAYIRKKYNLLVGDTTAEEIKIQIGSALPLDEDRVMEVRGRDQVAGLPKTIQITSGEVTEAIAEPLAAIIGAVKGVLEKTPPELSSDIIDRGMIIVGGGALLRQVDAMLTQATGVPCFVSDDPQSCVALGAGMAFENGHIMRRLLLQAKASQL